MKRTAYFINTSRGGVVDEKALYEALKNDIIAGAGLDVFEIEPLPKNSPLLSLDNVILTPHNADSAIGRCAVERDFLHGFETICQNIIRVTKGETPLHLINLDKPLM